MSEEDQLFQFSVSMLPVFIVGIISVIIRFGENDNLLDPALTPFRQLINDSLTILSAGIARHVAKRMLSLSSE